MHEQQTFAATAPVRRSHTVGPNKQTDRQIDSSMRLLTLHTVRKQASTLPTFPPSRNYLGIIDSHVRGGGSGVESCAERVRTRSVTLAVAYVPYAYMSKGRVG